MRREIMIDGNPVMMEANGATPRVYRNLFGSDLLVSLHGAVSKTGEVVNIEVFENLAYCMAKQAGSVSEDIDSWLASFNSSMAILNAVGDIMKLWRGQQQTTVKAKKKVNQ